VTGKLRRLGKLPDPKKPTVLRGSAGVWNCESGGDGEVAMDLESASDADDPGEIRPVNPTSSFPAQMMSEPEPKPESRITLIVEHMSPRGTRSVSPLSAEIDSAPTPLPVGRGAAAGLESKPSFDGADATPSISKPYYAAQSACPDMDMDVDVPAALDVPANVRERLAKEKNPLGCHGLVGGLDIGIDGEMGGGVGGDEGETKVAVVVEEAKAVSAVSRKAETKEMVIPGDEPRPKEVGGSSTQSVKARGKAKAKVREREGGLKV